MAGRVRKEHEMKKIVTVVMEVETDESDEFIKDDLYTEINCASCFYEIKEITIVNEQK